MILLSANNEAKPMSAIFRFSIYNEQELPTIFTFYLLKHRNVRYWGKQQDARPNFDYIVAKDFIYAVFVS